MIAKILATAFLLIASVNVAQSKSDEIDQIVIDEGESAFDAAKRTLSIRAEFERKQIKTAAGILITNTSNQYSRRLFQDSEEFYKRTKMRSSGTILLNFISENSQGAKMSTEEKDHLASIVLDTENLKNNIIKEKNLNRDEFENYLFTLQYGWIMRDILKYLMNDKAEEIIVAYASLVRLSNIDQNDKDKDLAHVELANYVFDGLKLEKFIKEKYFEKQDIKDKSGEKIIKKVRTYLVEELTSTLTLESDYVQSYLFDCIHVDLPYKKFRENINEKMKGLW